MDENSLSSFRHIAHDLNNIFTRILNSIELLKRKINRNDESLLLLNNIESGTYLATEIIGDLISSQSKNEIPRRIKINSIIQDIAHTFAGNVKDRISIELTLTRDLGLVEGKYSDYYRIILNLVSNSLDAIQGSGKICIVSKSFDDQSIKIEISDSGSGIDNEILSHIFDENFSTKESKTLRGYGLSIVKNLVEKNHGKIEVESKKDEGTKFILILPVIKVDETAANGKSILIAEDENILRELLTDLLQSYGYNVTAVQNGKDALQSASEQKYDLMVIDRKMPVMNGKDCIDHLRKAGIDMPVILASGSPLNENETDVKADKIINKPYNFDEMLSVVRELIG